ncbi:GntR family transcriptional regulator [Isoptericola variabilis]|uniref:Transcriptional regulator, GntR family n=1 Tax=Isoptericola variabilis (strain 225) TaxID=743718 RepID=F6FTB4_ISOV2|nr:GntR family transcriptional regulator [Isoptericola variabilis]AEG45278.1 transcriptional regulator, GntR family [Isoptericola variabilis 225]TWH34778.1 DNA-binding transcriptional regulator YhcF (GntR family) [Isoptericola variabilis J7]
MSDITVDLTSPTPVYEQIRSQVAGLVAVGTLSPGDRLPASRALARDLGIAVGTVQRAYRELEASGVVTSRRRTGTVVAAAAGRGDVDGRAPGRAGTVEDARRLVARAREAGLSDEAILDVVRGVLREP